MQPKIFDIHSHLNFRDFDGNREAIIKKMREDGIWTICVGADGKTSKECVELAGKYENIFASVGLHPTEDIKCPLGHLMSKLKELAQHPKVVAIGECGLDYFRIKNEELRIKQKELFVKQIELATELNKPLMIHCRDAHDEVIAILNTYYSIHNTKLRGNIHFFSGAWEQAQKYFDLGFTLSFAGPITFPPSGTSFSQYDETIKNAPIDKIMIETDAPFAAPAPYRGKRNEPAYVIEIAKKIAEIKGIKIDEVLRITTTNALRLFIGRDF